MEKNKKKIKAFTLIELLSVIIIIGVLSVIIIPRVSTSIKDSSEKTNKASAEHLLSAALYKSVNNELPSKNENLIIDYDSEINIEEIQYSGQKPEKGQVMILEDGHVVMAVKIKNMCYIKRYNSTEIETLPYDENTCYAPASFETDSWETISRAIKDGETEMYKIGDSKQITLGNNLGTHKIRIINKSTPESCNSDSFSQTACGFVVEFEDIISQHTMNDQYYTGEKILSTGNIGGWEYSGMREYINREIYNSLPTELKNIIINTKVVSSHGGNDSNDFTTNDNLYLSSVKEIWGNNGYELDYETSKDSTRQLDYYEQKKITNEDSILYNISGKKLKKAYNNASASYWLRSSQRENSNNFMYIDFDGMTKTTGSASWEQGVSPLFRIG